MLFDLTHNTYNDFKTKPKPNISPYKQDDDDDDQNINANLFDDNEEEEVGNNDGDDVEEQEVDNNNNNGDDNNDRQNDDELVESPSPPLEIEGVVEGEADNGQLQSQGGLLTDDNEV